MDLDDAVHRCAWCGIEVDEGAGRFVAFTLSDRKRMAGREGLAVQIAIGDERIVLGVMSRADSDAARAGEDIVFRACTKRCGRATLHRTRRRRCAMVDSMIRKLASGKYRLYSRKRDPRTGKRRNLGTFSSRAAAERHERAVQFFKRR